MHDGDEPGRNEEALRCAVSEIIYKLSISSPSRVCAREFRSENSSNSSRTAQRRKWESKLFSFCFIVSLGSVKGRERIILIGSMGAGPTHRHIDAHIGMSWMSKDIGRSGI